MAFDYTDPKAWQGAFNPDGPLGPGLGKYGVTEEELRQQGILFGQGPTGFVDRETRQPIDPNNIPLPGRAQIPALLDKVGGYASQLGQYATQAGQDIAEKAGNIWDRIDSEYQKDPDKFIDAVNRFGRSVFEEQNTGVQWGPPGAKVTDWGKHFGAATDVYDPDSKYNMDKRAAQRAEQKDIIALGMAQVESQIQQITLGKSEAELKQLLDKVENASYHELPAELKPVYNSLVTQGNTPEQAMNIIGEALRKRYEAETKEIETGIEKTKADIAKTMSATDAQKLETAVAQANKGLGNPESLKDIDNGSVYAAWWAEFNKDMGTLPEEERKNKAWAFVTDILTKRRELEEETQKIENENTAVITRIKEWGFDAGNPEETLKDDKEALAAWNATYRTAQGTEEERVNQGWRAVDTLMKLRKENEGMIDLSSGKVTDYDKKILAAIQRLRVAHPKKYDGKTDHQMYGDAQAFLEQRDIDIDITKTLNKLEAQALSDQRKALTGSYTELRTRIHTYRKALETLQKIPEMVWSEQGIFHTFADMAIAVLKGERAKWRGDVDTLEKLTTEISFIFVSQTKGAISDKEMDLFKSAVISWDGTKESNIKYVKYLIGKAESKLEQISKLDKMAKEKNRKDRLSVEEIEAAGGRDNGNIKPDIVPLLEARQGQQPPQNTSQDSGTVTNEPDKIPQEVIDTYYRVGATIDNWNAIRSHFGDLVNLPPHPNE